MPRLYLRQTKSKPFRIRFGCCSSGLAQFAESIRDQWVKRFGIASRWQSQIHLQIIPGKLGDTARFGRIPNATGSWITEPPYLISCPAGN